VFQAAAWLISEFYELTNNYAVAIALVAVTIMLLLLPLTLKSTKSMLEMQRIQPEMRRLQQQHRGDRQKLNEEMMKLYQEHKVNPMASCLPLVAQFPIFIVMFRVLHKLTEKGPDGFFTPSYLNHNSQLYKDLTSSTEMLSFGLDLSKRPIEVIQDSPGKGIIYALLVILLGGLYFVQQRMIASRTPATGMSPSQQKLMQYMPVGFAFFQLFFPVGLVIYYITQTLVRIAQQHYITRRFYRGEHSLGRQAQAAGAKAREMAKEDGGGGGLMASLRQEAASQKSAKGAKPIKATAKDVEKAPTAPTPSKRVTPPKSRPTPNRSARPAPPNRPKPSGSSRPTKPTKP
jgi:YidC/Oxa1 family membrane protein insertase